MGERGLSFMGPLVPLVLSGAKTVTRRTGRKPAEVGDLLWIREAWATHYSVDHRPIDQTDREWWHDCGFGVGIAGMPILPPVWYSDERDPNPGEWRGARGRPRQARFLPLALARPWRGRVVSVERVPAPPHGIDDDEARREGVRWRLAPRLPDGDDSPGFLGLHYTLDGGVTWGRTARDAFLAAWQRLHPDAPSHCWRVEWVPHV